MIFNLESLRRIGQGSLCFRDRIENDLILKRVVRFHEILLISRMNKQKNTHDGSIWASSQTKSMIREAVLPFIIKRNRRFQPHPFGFFK